jgi:hypothetical protein
MGPIDQTQQGIYYLLCIIARIMMTAGGRINVDDNDFAAVIDGNFVEIRCSSGYGVLNWEFSSGEAITESNALDPPFPIYQTFDPANDFQSLYIQRFSPADIAHYICNTGIILGGVLFKESVYITSGKCEN